MDESRGALKDGEMYRLFVALSLPEIAVDALSQLQSGVEGARWTPPENSHLTLQFIGETDRHGLRDIDGALSGVLAPRFELRLSGAGFFGGAKPRSLWVGAAPSQALDHLQAKVATALAREGFAPERRKFMPHVTLAYLSGTSQAAAAHFAAMHGLFSFGPFAVDAFDLFESRLGGEAAHYESLATYPLSSSM